jgi:hypothetical protein
MSCKIVVSSSLWVWNLEQTKAIVHSNVLKN